MLKKARIITMIILASSVLYELIGPACAKLALFRSGVIQRSETGEERLAAAEPEKSAG